MKKAIQISIPEPCHEDWAKMTPTEKGKFCSVCTKEVIDFTETTDEALVKRVIEGKNLCGRFKKSQLDREIKLERKSSNSLLPYAASLLMPLSIMASEVKNNFSNIEKPFISLGIGSNPVKAIIQVSGYVIDENGVPINNAEVIVLETGKSVRTNEKGFYQLKCVSGATVFAKKGEELRSVETILGNKDINVDLILNSFVKVKPNYEIISMTVGELVTIDIPENEEIDKEIVKDSIIEKEDTSLVTIKGTVVDEMGLPLPGVNVIEKGTTNGTQTDFDGNYEIEVEPNQTLEFLYIGYTTKEIKISNISNTIDLKMDAYYLGGLVGHVVVSETSEKVVVNPYQSNSYFDEEQRANRDERRAYTEKVNAFKRVKAERQKEARKLKRKNRKNK